MKVSNTLVDNATIKQLKRGTLLIIKGQYMMESNTLVGDVAYNSLIREVLQDTIGLHIKANKQWKGLKISGCLAMLSLDKVMLSL